MVSIPPEFAVSQAAGFIKGKSAIHCARMYRSYQMLWVAESREVRNWRQVDGLLPTSDAQQRHQP